MAKIKLSLSNLSVAQKLARGRLIVTSMTGNAKFATPSPTLASVTTLLDNLETSAADRDTKKQAAKTATAVVEDNEDLVDAALTNLGNWAQGHVNGDAADLSSGGFPLQGAGGPQVLEQVTGLGASAGDNEGDVNLFWDPQDGVQYELQTSSNPNDATLWVHKDIFSQSFVTLTGLPTGQRCWFRVRAVGTNNQKGAWSDPANKIVP